jgi:hypothetical protein
MAIIFLGLAGAAAIVALIGVIAAGIILTVLLVKTYRLKCICYAFLFQGWCVVLTITGICAYCKRPKKCHYENEKNCTEWVKLKHCQV